MKPFLEHIFIIILEIREMISEINLRFIVNGEQQGGERMKRHL